MKNKNNLLSVLLYLSIIFLILTLSISLPILVRPFYYAHIDEYNIDEHSGFTKNEIKEAYNDVLDYLIIPSKTSFSAGVMKFSVEGADHFLDCKKLFALNFKILFLAFLALSLIIVLKKRMNFKLSYFFSHTPLFWSGITTISLPVILGLLIVPNPDYAFVLFHKIFFPGKDNWIFNPYTDEIISVLPQQFFFNCALLIGTSMLILSIICIIFDFHIKGSDKK